ncbi:hypothetical protein EXIGLDRAFT_842847 [Exidia glandulosa HHB12029]|uniref:Uncharacterized protein n=1 Tax=Exidia glandulosa HHB12029 TaxID=1314781 RepID=A0A165D097_EXIGL|nr:hypothetical protein EXIGLDRAFT_842847 [Exidia glandulosa HHB12029]
MSATVFTAHDDAWQTGGWVRFSQTVPLDQRCQTVGTGGMQSVAGAWLTPQDKSEDWSLRLPFTGSTVYLYGKILRVVDSSKPMSLALTLEDSPGSQARAGSSLGGPTHGSTPFDCGVLLGSISASSPGNHVLSITGSRDGNWFALYNATVFAQSPSVDTPSPKPAVPSSTSPTSPDATPVSSPSSSSKPAADDSSHPTIPSSQSSASPASGQPTTAPTSSTVGTGTRESASSLVNGSSAVLSDASPVGPASTSSGLTSSGPPPPHTGVNLASIVVPIIIVLSLLLGLLLFVLYWRRRRARVARVRAERAAKPFEVMVEQSSVPRDRDRDTKGGLTSPTSESDSSLTDGDALSSSGVDDISQAVVLLDAVRSAGFTPQALLSSLRRVHDPQEDNAPPRYD